MDSVIFRHPRTPSQQYSEKNLLKNLETKGRFFKNQVF